MPTLPNSGQISQTVQMMMDVSLGVGGTLDNLSQTLQQLNGTQILNTAANIAQTTAGLVAIASVFTVVGPGVVVGTALVAVTLTITKELNATAPPGAMTPPINLGDLLAVGGNLIAIAGAGLPLGSIVGLGLSIAGGVFNFAGILQNNLLGGLAAIPNFANTLLNDLYATWRTAEATVSPLILDLDGDGVETTNRTQGIRFDHQADGFAENTGWAGRDDGMLVRDLNGDGSINNGRELFGNNTLLANGQTAANGFEALRALDSNADGIVSSADMAWAELRVWRDADGDGVTDAGELLSLQDAGVQSINLTYTNQGVNVAADANGNQHQQTGGYTTTGGQTRGVDDVWFATNNWDTVDQRPTVAVSAAIAALPNLQGPGNLGSLHQAMARDTTGALQTAVTSYVNSTSSSQRSGLNLSRSVLRWECQPISFPQYRQKPQGRNYANSNN